MSDGLRIARIGAIAAFLDHCGVNGNLAKCAAQLADIIEGVEKKIAPERPQEQIVEFLEYLGEINPAALYPSDMREAIVGYVERFGQAPLALLDRTRCIDILVDGGMPRDEAEEYFEFNTIGSWMGDGTPCFAVFLKDL